MLRQNYRSELVVAAADRLEELEAEYAKALERLEQSKQALWAAEWCLKGDADFICPICYENRLDGHSVNCIIGQVLAEKKGD